MKDPTATAPTNTAFATAATGDLQRLEAELASLKTQLEEARDEAELNQLMLQQVQEELEFYFLAHQKQEELLQRHRAEEARAEALIAALLERVEAQARA